MPMKIRPIYCPISIYCCHTSLKPFKATCAAVPCDADKGIIILATGKDKTCAIKATCDIAGFDPFILPSLIFRVVVARNYFRGQINRKEIEQTI